MAKVDNIKDYYIVDDLIGYKAVVAKNRWGWVIMRIIIPKGSIVIPSGDHIYRTDKCIPTRFSSAHYKHPIIETEFRSWFKNDFIYVKDKLIESELEFKVGESCLPGIHFFCDFNSAVNFGNANFGIDSAM